MRGGFYMLLRFSNLYPHLFAVDILSDGLQVAEFVIVAVIIIALTTLLFFILKRLYPRIILVLMSALIIGAALFDLLSLVIVAGVVYILLANVFLFGNITEVRWLISNTASQKDRRRGRRKFRKIYDQDSVLLQVQNAVRSLAKTKTGALITFELGTPLTEVLKNGTPIKAPVTAPLLTTIFYKGTALHDGAVVIRDDEIVAASVYFTPSTKPLAGKVGSRHRAALGVSEVSDTVTLVVSEETGRVSIAYKGELRRINVDDVQKVIAEHLVKV